MKYLWDDETRKWVAPEIVLARRANAARSDHAAPMILGTAIDDVWNPVNGKRYTCKRAYERDVNASGNRIAGNDLDFAHARPKEKTTPSAKQDIAQAWDQLTSR